MAEGICAIVLAAGHGSRYRALAGEDRNKLLAPCIGRDGVERKVLEHTLLNLRGAVERCVLVARPGCRQSAHIAHYYGCEVVALASAGMGDSIAAAVVCAPKQRGWLVLPGDMPFILPESLHAVVAAIADDAISAPVYRGERGHPVGFGRHFGAGLMQLSGEQGARRLFSDACVQLLEVDDPGVLWDVDVPERLVFQAVR